jgi:hypothetical protein
VIEVRTSRAAARTSWRLCFGPGRSLGLVPGGGRLGGSTRTVSVQAPSTNPLEWVNRESGRRTDVVGIFPNGKALIRLAASVVIEQNDEWLVGRYLSNYSLEAVLDQERKEDKDREETRELTAPEQPTISPMSYTTSWDLTHILTIPLAEYRFASACGI